MLLVFASGKIKLPIQFSYILFLLHPVGPGIPNSREKLRQYADYCLFLQEGKFRGIGVYAVPFPRNLRVVSGIFYRCIVVTHDTLFEVSIRIL